MKSICTILMGAIATLSSGCATITSSESQPVTVTTQNEAGQALEQAKCTLRNDKGEWQMQTPGFATVRKSSADLLVECKKDGQPDGLVRAVSRVGAGMFGNIIFGGGIGAIIDHSKGTAYNYPDALPVRMGQSITVDRGAQDAPPDTQQSKERPKN